MEEEDGEEEAEEDRVGATEENIARAIADCEGRFVMTGIEAGG